MAVSVTIPKVFYHTVRTLSVSVSCEINSPSSPGVFYNAKPYHAPRTFEASLIYGQFVSKDEEFTRETNFPDTQLNVYDTKLRQFIGVGTFMEMEAKTRENPWILVW